MAILISNGILKKIEEEIHNCSQSFYAISAFCKITLLEFFDSNLSEDVYEKKLVVRMRPEDIICGATDISLYEYCKKHNWKLYFNFDLHAKTYVFDKMRCIVGSANATSTGMSLDCNGNYEMATVSILDNKDRQAIGELVENSVLMIDKTYSIMCKSLEKMKIEKEHTSLIWPDEIRNLYKKKIDVLFVEDFPAQFSPLDFIGMEDIKVDFYNSKGYQWIKDELMKKDSHELYFGEASSLLHNKLVKDPKPYRKEVKELLSNLLNWIVELGCEEILIDRPNYSQRIKLVEN